MSRTTSTFTISLPPEMEVVLEDVMRMEHRTRSELVREALRRYFQAVQVESKKAKRAHIEPAL